MTTNEVLAIIHGTAPARSAKTPQLPTKQAKPPTGSKLKGFAILASEDGTLTRVTTLPSNLTTRDFGYFSGKAGSIRRSKKGQTRRVPNGRRFYIPNAPEVIAYKVGPA